VRIGIATGVVCGINLKDTLNHCIGQLNAHSNNEV